MNKDLIVGLVVSITVHLVALNPFAGKLPPPKRPPPVKEEVVQFEMPPLDEEKEEKVEELNDEPVENVMAPPSLVDLPTVVPVQAFTQPLQPPPPPGMTASKGAINIPVTKPGANFGKGIKDLFDINNLDQRPVARVQPQPAYPYEMSRAGISGEVVVEFIINANGDVVDTRVMRSSHREFEIPAMQAVQKWKFKAGRKGGRAVNVRASQLIEFNLEDSK
ncbi:MAG: energy transducer TonB [Opitutae bacterium]|nr:energy transducer TonB [Opitutae bacterium]